MQHKGVRALQHTRDGDTLNNGDAQEAGSVLFHKARARKVSHTSSCTPHLCAPHTLTSSTMNTTTSTCKRGFARRNGNHVSHMVKVRRVVVSLAPRAFPTSSTRHTILSSYMDSLADWASAWLMAILTCTAVDRVRQRLELSTSFMYTACCTAAAGTQCAGTGGYQDHTP